MFRKFINMDGKDVSDIRQLLNIPYYSTRFVIPNKGRLFLTLDNTDEALYKVIKWIT